jgi:hypothetical protein
MRRVTRFKRSTSASKAWMPNARPQCCCQAPQPRSGAPKAQGLIAALWPQHNPPCRRSPPVAAPAADNPRHRADAFVAPQLQRRFSTSLTDMTCRPIGLSLSQIEPSASGPDGKIVHLQITNLDQSVIDWVISQTAKRLAQAGADVIRCRASSPQTIAALQRTGSIAAPSQPVHWWARGGGSPPSAIDVGYLCANDALPLDAAATLIAR